MIRIVIALTALLAGAAHAYTPGDPAQGQKLSRMCSVCHGKDGKAVRANTPNIGGQDEGYLAAQLANFRSGDRVHPEMNIVAGPLTDEQIADLAAWYAAQELPSD